MHIKTLIFCFMFGLASLSLVSCSGDHGHEAASSHGHSHAPADEQLGQKQDKIVHDNIDSK